MVRIGACRRREGGGGVRGGGKWRGLERTTLVHVRAKVGASAVLCSISGGLNGGSCCSVGSRSTERIENVHYEL